MSEPSRLIVFFEKPLHQALLVAAMIFVFSLVDFVMPHNNTLLDAHSGPWIVSTSMVLCFVIMNSLIALRIENVLPYWSRSVMFYLGLLIFGYGWSLLLSGKHIDDVGSFRWLWFVLTMVYMVFFTIARSVKRVVDIANKQDEKLRGE
jgi:hypothetical protein